MEDRLEDAYPAAKKDIDSLVSKGLIKFVGYDPLGRPVYSNTELGNEIADYLDKMEKEDVRPKRKARSRR